MRPSITPISTGGASGACDSLAFRTIRSIALPPSVAAMLARRMRRRNLHPGDPDRPGPGEGDPGRARPCPGGPPPGLRSADEGPVPATARDQPAHPRRHRPRGPAAARRHVRAAPVTGTSPQRRRVSQIESGDVSAQGRAEPDRRRARGTLRLIADFGDYSGHRAVVTWLPVMVIWWPGVCASTQTV